MHSPVQYPLADLQDLQQSLLQTKRAIEILQQEIATLQAEVNRLKLKP